MNLREKRKGSREPWWGHLQQPKVTDSTRSLTAAAVQSFGCHVPVCVRRPGEQAAQSRGQSAEPPAPMDGSSHSLTHGMPGHAAVRSHRGTARVPATPGTVTASRDSQRRPAQHLQDRFSRETTRAREDAGDKLTIETEKPLVEKPYLGLTLLPLLFKLQSPLQLPQRGSVYGVLRVLELDDLVKHSSELV